MSLQLRTRIGSTLRTLTKRLDTLSSFLHERGTVVHSLEPLEDHELLIDIEYITEARRDVVDLFRKIETALDRWKTLGKTDPKEKESHASFTTTDEHYLSLTSETRETLSRTDDILTMLVHEATIRALDIPQPSDDLSSHGSVHDPPSTRRPSQLTIDIDPSSPPVTATAPGAAPAAANSSSERGVPVTTHLQSPSLHSCRSSFTTRSESLQASLPLFSQFPGLRPPSDTALIPPNPAPPPQLAPSFFLQSALASRAQLPSFDGDLTKWPSFKAAFLALLGDAALPGCHKLAILKSCLSGEASEMISGLSQIDADYDTAMSILHAEYDRPSLIRHALLTRLQSIENCDPEGTQLRRIYMELTTIIHQLCPEGESDSPDFLVNLIITKLPISLQTRIMKETQRKTIGVFSVLNIMRDAVDDDRIERLLTVTHSPHSPRMNHSPSLPSSPSHSHPNQSAYSSERPLICPLCDGPHFTKHCSSFKSPYDKKKAVIERGLCLNCLSRSHHVDDCINRHSCWHCNQRHHSSICTDRSIPRENTQEHSSHPSRPSPHRAKTVSFSPPMSQPARDITLHVNSSPLPHEKDSSLLCLDVNVSSPNYPEEKIAVTLVLDTGSNQSYVSNDLVSDLSLPSSQQIMRSRTVFGNEEPQPHLTSTHSLLISLPSGHQEKIDLHATPSVCPTLDWTVKKGELLIPRRSRPMILLGMDLLRRFFFTPSLRVESFSNYDIIHTSLGDCISMEKEPHPISIATLTLADFKLPPDKAPSLGDEPASSILSGSSKPDHENSTLGHLWPFPALSSFQAATDLSSTSCPPVSLSHRDDSSARSDRATLSLHSTTSKDKDNPPVFTYSSSPSTARTHSLRAGE